MIKIIKVRDHALSFDFKFKNISDSSEMSMWEKLKKSSKSEKEYLSR